MRRIKGSNLWVGQVNGSTQTVNVVGTYGDSNRPDPIVRVEEGADKGKAFAITWETGKVIREIQYQQECR